MGQGAAGPRDQWLDPEYQVNMLVTFVIDD
jgi:hypothetical protein